MFRKGFEKILNEYPILLVNAIYFHRDGVSYQATALAVNREREDGTKLRYTVIDRTCDNLAKTLLHETLHHRFEGWDEEKIKRLTDVFWNSRKYRKMFVDKLVSIL